jgi:hypothetical protein
MMERTDMDAKPAVSSPSFGLIAAGAILLVVGGALWLDASGMLDIPVRQLIAPLVLIALGTLMAAGKGGVVYQYRERPDDGRRLRRSGSRGSHTGGIWLIGIGGWMLLAQTHVFGLDFHNSWPLFIILSGLTMLIRGLR